MKIKAVVLVLCVSLCSTVFASNMHPHPEDKAANKTSKEQAIKSPGYCEIELINSSYDNVTVSGVFDDGLSLATFSMYSFGMPQYIDMYYYGYCHAGMSLYIDTWSGYRIFAGYAQTNTTIRVVPYLANQLKAEVTKK